jgi:hypothetical protein
VSQKLSCVSTFPIAPAAQHDKNATWSGLDADTTLCWFADSRLKRHQSRARAGRAR